MISKSLTNVKEFLMGFSKKDRRKIITHLKRLLSHLDLKRIVFVGGLVVRYHITQAGISYPLRPMNDLDILAEDIGVVSPEVKDEFLVYHHHPPNKKGNFYLVLVDPRSKTKIDIFDYSLAPEEVQEVPFEKYLLRVISAEDQLVKTIFDIQRISENAKVDPKQFCDARLLLQIVDVSKADMFWKRKKFQGLPNSLIDAFQRAEAIAKQHPEWLQEKPFRKIKPYRCPECVSTQELPITPMEEIYKILGYIE